MRYAEKRSLLWTLLMKKPLSFLLPGAIAIVLIGAPMVAAQARSLNRLAQNQQPKQERLNQLNLTEAQRTRMREIRESTQSQVQGVLTQEQRDRYQAAIQQGQNPRQAMRSLNLSEAQRTRIREIKQASKTQMQEVLTPEQRQQLEQIRSNRQNRQGTNR